MLESLSCACLPLHPAATVTEDSSELPSQRTQSALTLTGSQPARRDTSNTVRYSHLVSTPLYTHANVVLLTHLCPELQTDGVPIMPLWCSVAPLFAAPRVAACSFVPWVSSSDLPTV